MTSALSSKNSIASFTFAGAAFLSLWACSSAPSPTSPTSDVPVASSASAGAWRAPQANPSSEPVSASKSSSNFSLKDNRLEVPGPVLFRTGTEQLLPESDKVLDHVVDFLRAKPDVTTLRIEVHTDSQGASAMNQALSEKRALSVAKALVKKGIDCKRLIAAGFGSTKPIADNNTAEGRAANRRTEFVVAALRNRAIGGFAVDGGGVASDPCAPLYCNA